MRTSATQFSAATSFNFNIRTNHRPAQLKDKRKRNCGYFLTGVLLIVFALCLRYNFLNNIFYLLNLDIVIFQKFTLVFQNALHRLEFLGPNLFRGCFSFSCCSIIPAPGFAAVLNLQRLLFRSTTLGRNCAYRCVSGCIWFIEFKFSAKMREQCT